MSRETVTLLLGVYFGINLGFVLGAFWSGSPRHREGEER